MRELTIKTRKKRARAMNRLLRSLFPKAKTPLRHRSNWELLIAVILSAQTTDRKVNEVTKKIFRKYRGLMAYVKTEPREFAYDIKEIGLYRSKAKNILASAKIVAEEHGGRVPKTMEELVALPGVGRKTANVVLGNAYGICEGIAVDTHVKRFARRFDLTDHKDPEKIEKNLMELLPKKDWFGFSHRLIAYGRSVCPARRHDCAGHPLTKLYPRAATRWLKA